jgi:hypothetical protein
MGGGTSQTPYVLYLETNNKRTAEEQIIPLNSVALTFWHRNLAFNPLPLLFKFLLPGQEDCVFFSGHLNLHAKPETGIPYRE